MTSTLVLTRPEAQSRALAVAFADMARVVITPVMEIVGTGVTVDLTGYAGVILTSANAVVFAPDPRGVRVFCVGGKTAEAARAEGAEVALVAEDADDLVARCTGPGPLLHLRGEHARGDVAERLSSAGIETHEAVLYRQEERALTEEALGLLTGNAPVVLPLFSPRSAELVGAQVGTPGPGVRVLAMSPAVAERWQAVTGGSAEVCARPTGEEMRERIAAILRG